ncbi:3'(2'),5'-bisphosphate nucleotidase 1 isoform X2 [Brevipalpus obovatus]|uniref:3'(2'),5'-bisphosphate nucleotidase 1 isoform X2 n=1 Tax=Brevipalpus obovatus TaxID=246614 RepID=UPI003D9E16F1
MSTANIPTLIRLVSASVCVAKRAGLIVKNVLNKGPANLGKIDKGVDDFSTEADRRAQRCIVASLSKGFPKITIIGEEVNPNDPEQDGICQDLDSTVLSHECPARFQSIKEEDIVVWVDPLDGTREFAQGLLEEVTILIGIAINGEPVSGVVHQPYYQYKVGKDPFNLGRTMWGIVGLGGFGIDKKDPPANGPVIVTTRSHRSKLVDDTLLALKPTNDLRVGGAGNKVLYVIEGKAHAYVYPSPGTKKWDTCAPQAILHSLGGRMTDIYGNEILYHKDAEYPNVGGILAAHSEEANQAFCKNIPEHVKEELKQQTTR